MIRATSITISCFFVLSAWAGCSRAPNMRGAAAARVGVEATVSSVTSGTVKAEKVAELAFGTVGRVRRLNIRLGDSVKRDAILAELENDELLSSLETAEAELKRQENLFRTKSASPRDLDQARSAFEVARAAFEKSLIRAPYDGIIAELNLEVGQLSQITAVMPRAPIRIVDIEPRYIRAELDEVDLPKVREGMDARVKILSVRREPFKAVVRKIVPWVSLVREQDRTTEFELTIDSEGLLLPAGASADVEVVVGRSSETLAVPSRAILGRGNKRYVFCFENGRARKTPVRIGLSNYDRSEILEGLSQGSIVLYPSEQVELLDDLKIELDLQLWP